MPDAKTVLGAVDAKDLDRMSALITGDARMVMGNQEPLVGREAIMAGQAAFFTMIQSLRHEVLHEWAVGAVTIAETEVTYTRLDGKEITVPAVTIWEVDGNDLMTDLRIFADQGPVWAP